MRGGEPPRRQGRRGQSRAEPDLELNELARKVIGAAIEVHRVLGPGFLESVYEEALCVELTARGVRWARQVPLTMEYKGHLIGEARLDLLVDERLVVELKAVQAFAPNYLAQLLSSLKATHLHLGLLINFNAPVLPKGIQRVIAERTNALAPLASWR